MAAVASTTKQNGFVTLSRLWAQSARHIRSILLACDSLREASTTSAQEDVEDLVVLIGKLAELLQTSATLARDTEQPLDADVGDGNDGMQAAIVEILSFCAHALYIYSKFRAFVASPGTASPRSRASHNIAISIRRLENRMSASLLDTFISSGTNDSLVSLRLAAQQMFRSDMQYVSLYSLSTNLENMQQESAGNSLMAVTGLRQSDIRMESPIQSTGYQSRAIMRSESARDAAQKKLQDASRVDKRKIEKARTIAATYSTWPSFLQILHLVVTSNVSVCEPDYFLDAYVDFESSYNSLAYASRDISRILRAWALVSVQLLVNSIMLLESISASPVQTRAGIKTKIQWGKTLDTARKFVCGTKESIQGVDPFVAICDLVSSELFVVGDTVRLESMAEAVSAMAKIGLDATFSELRGNDGAVRPFLIVPDNVDAVEQMSSCLLDFVLQIEGSGLVALLDASVSTAAGYVLSVLWLKSMHSDAYQKALCNSFAYKRATDVASALLDEHAKRAQDSPSCRTGKWEPIRQELQQRVDVALKTSRDHDNAHVEMEIYRTFRDVMAIVSGEVFYERPGDVARYAFESCINICNRALTNYRKDVIGLAIAGALLQAAALLSASGVTEARLWQYALQALRRYRSLTKLTRVVRRATNVMHELQETLGAVAPLDGVHAGMELLRHGQSRLATTVCAYTSDIGVSSQNDAVAKRELAEAIRELDAFIVSAEREMQFVEDSSVFPRDLPDARKCIAEAKKTLGESLRVFAHADCNTLRPERDRPSTDTHIAAASTQPRLDSPDTTLPRAPAPSETLLLPVLPSVATQPTLPAPFVPPSTVVKPDDGPVERRIHGPEVATLPSPTARAPVPGAGVGLSQVTDLPIVSTTDTDAIAKIRPWETLADASARGRRPETRRRWSESSSSDCFEYLSCDSEPVRGDDGAGELQEVPLALTDGQPDGAFYADAPVALGRATYMPAALRRMRVQLGDAWSALLRRDVRFGEYMPRNDEESANELVDESVDNSNRVARAMMRFISGARVGGGPPIMPSYRRLLVDELHKRHGR